MFDWDVIIVGAGPAGLAAGLYLSRARRRTLVLDKESFGGYIKDVECIENYPGFAEGISGAQLASEMFTQATKYGLQFALADVVGIELFSSCRCVNCADGKTYTCAVVIFAGGSVHKKLGVPGEETLRGKGVFNCAFCDGGQFAGRAVAVCGGGDAGITEALYMTKLASKVLLIEAMPKLTATAVLQERALSNPKMEIHCGVRVEAIAGDAHVKAIELQEVESGRRRTQNVDGVLVHIGLDPATSYLQGVVPLDDHGQILVNDKMETEVPFVFAAGDIRTGSPRQVVTAVGDGATAAIHASRLLDELQSE
jgi:thioredoxin reductase (NADPH)